jgi:hypothetical protein
MMCFKEQTRQICLKKTIALTTVTPETSAETLPDLIHSQTILIVEDDEEIRLYLKNELESNYHILYVLLPPRRDLNMHFQKFLILYFLI